MIRRQYSSKDLRRREQALALELNVVVVDSIGHVQIRGHQYRQQQHHVRDHDLEEQPALQDGHSNLYPTPRDVEIQWGNCGTCSILERSLRMWTSTVRGFTKDSPFQTRSSTSSRVKTRFG